MRTDSVDEALLGIELELVLLLPVKLEPVPDFVVPADLEPVLVIVMEPGELVLEKNSLSLTIGASMHHWIIPVTKDRGIGGLREGGCSNGS